ncbi:hypothetical protein HETIRDRAFT_317551 [Heterobasidion irregulare TC 32-1]|uniref:Chitin-binding type-4 domain-containing protein n=1 Tax=Heterobasidion irregulare (strain TC 32-1) TaxID=747525 RepID=W4K8L4_HETIT|nr:uncharacterized protein HETIRDRAFT_317551 [Heterobasidion irregulare TC 32-1]ETW81690.1 hypothetical protein HETIRDRAFT_317551 [Heterobasidion irregulare TC 32-1]
MLSIPFLTTAAPLAYPTGVIVAPINGTSIMPGEVFDFKYNAHADYCMSSYNYSVWLVTDKPTMFMPSETFMTGHLFGTFQEANYPGTPVPYPSNPPPSQLVMPVLSQPQGGFGSGQSAANATFYLMVWEEWDSCDGALGTKISLSMNNIVYNATAA